MNIKSLTVFLLTISFCTQVQSEVVIESFQEDRDMPAIEKILDEYRSVLTYEARGYEEGMTKKYIVSTKYTTKVLRVDGETVGFINYVVIEPPFLLKLFMNQEGLVHLMGVDSNHQHKGYGKMLLRHALQDLKDKKLSKVRLSVGRENKAARSFYEKEGFTCAIPESAQSAVPYLIYEKDL